MATCFQYSCLRNPIDKRAWWTTVRGVTKELDTTELNSSNNKEGTAPYISLPLVPFHVEEGELWVRIHTC